MWSLHFCLGSVFLFCRTRVSLSDTHPPLTPTPSTSSVELHHSWADLRVHLRRRCVAALTGPSCLAVSQFCSDVIYKLPGLPLIDVNTPADRAADVKRSVSDVRWSEGTRVYIETGGGWTPMRILRAASPAKWPRVTCRGKGFLFSERERNNWSHTGQQQSYKCTDTQRPADEERYVVF